MGKHRKHHTRNSAPMPLGVFHAELSAAEERKAALAAQQAASEKAHTEAATLTRFLGQWRLATQTAARENERRAETATRHALVQEEMKEKQAVRRSFLDGLQTPARSVGTQNRLEVFTIKKKSPIVPNQSGHSIETQTDPLMFEIAARNASEKEETTARNNLFTMFQANKPAAEKAKTPTSTKSDKQESFGDATKANFEVVEKEGTPKLPAKAAMFQAAPATQQTTPATSSGWGLSSYLPAWLGGGK